MRFLIVDDSPEDRELVILKLRPAFGDAEFVQASGADELEQALARGGLDLVLTDYRLHWSDGLQVLKKAKSRFPALPVIMVTDSGTEELAVEGLRDGLSDYVLKRHLDRLPAAVQNSLERADVTELRAVHKQLEEANRVLQSQAQALQEKNQKLEQLAGELQAQRANMNAAVDGTPMSILVIDTAGRVIRMNPAAGRLYGRTVSSPFPLPELPRYHADHTPYDPSDLPLIRAVRLGEVQQNVEMAIPSPGGGWQYILVNAVPMLDATGHVSGAISLELDITSRKQAEEERERLLAQVRREWERAERLAVEAEQRATEIDAVFRALTDTVLVFGADDRVVQTNPVALDYLGFNPVGLYGTEVAARLAARTEHDGRSLTGEQLPSVLAMAGETVVDKCLILTLADGRESIVLVSASPLIEQGRVNGAVIGMHDVTEREQARDLSDVLSRINTQLITVRNPEEFMPQVLFEAARALEATTAALLYQEGDEWLVRHVYGLPGALIGKAFRVEEATLVTAVINVRDVMTVEHVLDREEKQEAVTAVLGIRAGIVVPLMLRGQVTGAMILGYSSRPRPFTVAQVNFARQIAASVSLAQENARLYEEARRDAETRAVLLNEVNHRVKNNLAAIVGLLYAQLDRPGMEGQPGYQVVIRDLIHWTEGLAIVHGMLSASDWAPLPLDELASRVIYSSLQSVPPGQVQVEVRPSPVRVSADQAHTLALVLNELATNVAKHALKGREVVLLNVEATQEGRDIVLRLRDNGPGYSPDVLAQQYPGVGLSLARNLVRRNLRGRLALYNDAGAVAEVRFPARGEVEQQHPETTAATKSAG